MSIRPEKGEGTIRTVLFAVLFFLGLLWGIGQALKYIKLYTGGYLPLPF